MNTDNLIAVLIEDSPIESLMGKIVLEKLNFEVYVARNGEEGLKIVHEVQPALVLCDLDLPDISGIEVIHRINTELTEPPIIIVATCLDDVDYAVEAIRQGAVDYLVKPLSEERLQSAFDKAIIKRKQKAQFQEEEIYQYDSLTGLFNRYDIEQYLTLVSEQYAEADHFRALPENVVKFVDILILLDVDGLQFINNTYGYREGDRTLIHVAKRLKTVLHHEHDAVARLGNDLFVVVLCCVERDTIDIRIQRVLNSIETEKIYFGVRPHVVTVTAGCTIFNLSHMEQHSSTELINNADIALNYARTVGRNRYHIYNDLDEAHRQELNVRFNSLELIRQGLQEGRFRIYFQPIVNLVTNQVTHYETLIRLLDENNNILPPELLIKNAEAFGLISKVDRWVVRTCLEQIKALHLNAPHISISINLSGKSFEDVSLLNELEDIFNSSDVDPNKIIFEITETAVFSNIERVRHFIRRLQNVGCRFALDDFGVGYSSFYYIKQLNIDYLKIDGCFIRNILTDQNDQVFVRALVEMGRLYGLKVIAEWVENREIANLLRDLGVDYGQGYLFGKPIAAAEFNINKTTSTKEI